MKKLLRNYVFYIKSSSAKKIAGYGLFAEHACQFDLRVLYCRKKERAAASPE
jgi:hypothetical protein